MFLSICYIYLIIIKEKRVSNPVFSELYAIFVAYFGYIGCNVRKFVLFFWAEYQAKSNIFGKYLNRKRQ